MEISDWTRRLQKPRDRYTCSFQLMDREFRLYPGFALVYCLLWNSFTEAIFAALLK